MSVEVQPRDRSQLPVQGRTIKSRDLRPSNRFALRTYLQKVNVKVQIGAAYTCAEKFSALEPIVQVRMELVLPCDLK